MKTRMTALDLRAIAQSLNQECYRLRIANVYDVANKTFVLKLSENNVADKKYLVLQSGVRIHLSKWKRSKEGESAVPSMFTMRLRKYIRTKRITSVRQLGSDRVLDFQIGSEDHAAHLIVELYSRGNVVLTDFEFTIIAALRQYRSVDSGCAVVVKEKYPVEFYIKADVLKNVYLPNLPDPVNHPDTHPDAHPDSHQTSCLNESTSPSDPTGVKGSVLAPIGLDKISNPALGAAALGQRITEIVRKYRLKCQEKMANNDGTAKPATRGGGGKLAPLKLSGVICELLPCCHRQMVSAKITDDILVSTPSDRDSENTLFDPKPLVDICAEAVRGLLEVWVKVHCGSPVPTPCSSNATNGASIGTNGVTVHWPGWLYENPVSKLLSNYSPYETTENKTDVSKHYDNFNEAVDEFYSRGELERADKHSTQALSKLEEKMSKIQRDQYARVLALEKAAEKATEQANLVEFHVEFVGRVAEMVNRLFATGNDWETLTEALREQAENNHPLARFVTNVDFSKTRVEIALPHTYWGKDFENVDQPLEKTPIADERRSDADPESDSEGSEDAGDGEADAHNDDDSADNSGDEAAATRDALVSVWVDFTLSAFANVKRFHDEKKNARVKYEKTKTASSQVLKQIDKLKLAEERERDKERADVKAISLQRKILWFERFFWFISSDGYLVLGGRDAIQNEILYKKYLTKDDLFVHADVHGAAACIIRNHGGGTATEGSPAVPQQTLTEAAIFAVCRSNAWKSKVVASAYWVTATQVSKTPQAGEYVSTGGFIIRGKRNFIPVNCLQLGVGLLFYMPTGEEGDGGSVEGSQSQENLSPLIDPKEEEQVDPDDRVDPKVGGVDPDVDGVNFKEDVEQQRKDSEHPDQTMISGDDARERDGSPLKFTEEGVASGGHVQFGACEVAPTPVITASVGFEPTQTEVIPVKSDRSVHSSFESEDEDDEASSEAVYEAFDKYHTGGFCDDLEHLRSSRRLGRPDSADELPPPSDYFDRAAPGPLLRKETPETKSLAQFQPETPIIVSVLTTDGDEPGGSPSKPRRRHTADDGPLPRGYLPAELPDTKLLLRRGSHPSPIQEESFSDALSDSAPPSEARHQLGDPAMASGSPSGHKKSTHYSHQNHPHPHHPPRDFPEDFAEDLLDEKIEPPPPSKSTDISPNKPPNKSPNKSLNKSTNKSTGDGESNPNLLSTSRPSGPAEGRGVERGEGGGEGRGASGKTQLSRAKIAKLKKMKQKYGEQSDEERELVMHLMGSRPVQMEPPAKAKREPSPAPGANASANLPPAVDRTFEGEEAEAVESSWQGRLEALSHLNPDPGPETQPSFAVVVVGPLSALSHCRFLGELTPGGAKKGAAVNVVGRAFVELAPKETHLRRVVRAVSADEYASALPTNPHVQVAGGAKIVKQQKKQKKAIKDLAKVK